MSGMCIQLLNVGSTCYSAYTNVFITVMFLNVCLAFLNVLKRFYIYGHGIHLETDAVFKAAGARQLDAQTRRSETEAKQRFYR